MPRRFPSSRPVFTSAAKLNHISPPRERSPKRTRCSSRSVSPKSPRSSKYRRNHQRVPIKSSARSPSRHSSKSRNHNPPASYSNRPLRYRSPSYERYNRHTRNRSPRQSDSRKRDETDDVINEARIAAGLIPLKNEVKVIKNGSNKEKLANSNAPSPSSSYGNSFTRNNNLAAINHTKSVENRHKAPHAEVLLDPLAYVPGEKLLDCTDIGPSGFDLFELTNSSVDRAHGSPINQKLNSPEINKSYPKTERKHVGLSSISVDSNSFNKCVQGFNLLQPQVPRKPHQHSSASTILYEATGTTSSSSSQIPFPALHLHLSEDGSSPLPPGWDRAPNPAMNSSSTNSCQDPSSTYSHYYYHVKTRLTRWDPPVYPWDADPESQQTIVSDWSNENPMPDAQNEDEINPLDQNFPPTPEIKSKDEPLDPESPYNWGLASRYQVTHEDIDIMYSRIRVQMLEKQCQEMIHEISNHQDCPKGPTEHSYATEIYSLVHNTLREFRDARCSLGRITNDEDLHALTRKLAQDITLKEIQKLRQSTSEQRARLLNIPDIGRSVPLDTKGQLIPALREKMQTYIRKYMTSKGPIYRGSAAIIASRNHHYFVPKPPPPPAPSANKQCPALIPPPTNALH